MAKIYNDSDETLISGSGASDSIFNRGDDVTINALSGNDTIENINGDYASINAGANNDTIRNYSSRGSTIDAGDGNDTITNQYGSLVSIDAGDGNDYIYNEGSSVTIEGGAGDDSIYNANGYVTIGGGAGNDFVSIESGVEEVRYNHSSGNDTIIGFHESDILAIASSTYSTAMSGNNLVVTTGKGSITLVDVGDMYVYVEPGTDTTPADTTSGGGGSDTQSGGTDTQTGGGSDTQTGGGDMEGKIVTNKTTKTSIVGTDYDDEIYNRASNVTIKGGDGGDYIATQRKTTSVKIYGEDGDDIIEANNATKVLLSGGAGNDEIYSSGKQNTIIGGVGNDSIEIDSTNTVIQYAVGDGNDVIEGFNETSTLKIGDGSGTYSTLDGGDDVILKIGDGQITLKGAASWLKFDDNESPANIAGQLSGGVFIVDNNTKTPLTIAEDVEVVDATKRTKAIKITGNELENTILGGSGKNTIYGGDGYDSIVGGKLADKLFGEGDDDTLWGGAGNDTLTGGDGNDLFVYTAGKDVITDYTVDDDAIQIAGKWTKSSVKGSDVVLTFGSTSKTLTIKDGKLKEILFVDADGNETTEIFGKTVIKKSNFVAGETDEYIDGSAWKKAATITGNDLDNTILGSSAYKNTIYGGEGDDYLVGGKSTDKIYGDEGNDTLWGGKGADTLYGGAGSDTFIYNPSEGKDVIYEFDEDDMLQITGTFTGTYYASSNTVVFKVNGSSSNTITLKEYATDTFNINGEIYEREGTKIVKQ